MPTDNDTVFLKAGRIWDNEIEIEFGHKAYYPIQITFRPDAPNYFAENEEESEQLTND